MSLKPTFRQRGPVLVRTAAAFLGSCCTDEDYSALVEMSSGQTELARIGNELYSPGYVLQSPIIQAVSHWL